MKNPLRVEPLEGRDCPAAGSSLVTIGVEPQFTLSVNTYGRFASMQVAAPEFATYATMTGITNAQVQTLTQRIYRYFPDQFDYIMFVDNLPDLAFANNGLFGFNQPVKNQTTGTGQALFNNTAAYGSSGKLNNVLFMGSELDMYHRTFLHEFLHRDANFLPQLNSSDPGHWGFSSVGGQLGGWAPGTLNLLVGNVPAIWEADGPAGRPYFYENSPDFPDDGYIPYAPLELYLMGLIDAQELDPIQYATNPAYVNFAQGIFLADSIQTLTYQNIVAQEGLRTPGPLHSQKDFRILTVVLTPNPMTQAEIDRFDTNVQLSSLPGSDGNPAVHNFWEATGGRARLTMDGLNAFVPTPTTTQLLAVGTGGGTLVGYPGAVGGLYNTNQVIRPDLSAFVAGTFTDIRTAVGDVDGDNIQDFAIASGPGSLTRFAVVSGDLSRYIIAPTLPFRGSEDFTGGAFVSLGDLDGDGREDVIISPDEGGGPRVTVFSLKPTTGLTVMANFLGINDPNFRGGARTAVGDVNNDGKPDLAVSAGFGGGPRVALYNGATLFTSRTKLVPDFFAFAGADATRLRNGLFLAIGDVNGDNFGDLVVGGGPGGAPRVSALSGQRLLTSAASALGAPLANFFVGNNTADRGGVRVAVKNVDGDNRLEIVTGSGEDTQSKIRVYRGTSITNTGEPRVFQDIDPFGGVLPDGIYVG